jgi:hypothetical protein
MVCPFGCQRPNPAAIFWKLHRATRAWTRFHAIGLALDCLCLRSFRTAPVEFTGFLNKELPQTVVIVWSIRKTRKTASNCRHDRRVSFVHPLEALHPVFRPGRFRQLAFFHPLE